MVWLPLSKDWAQELSVLQLRARIQASPLYIRASSLPSVSNRKEIRKSLSLHGIWHRDSKYFLILHCNWKRICTWESNILKAGEVPWSTEVKEHSSRNVTLKWHQPKILSHSKICVFYYLDFFQLFNIFRKLKHLPSLQEYVFTSFVYCIKLYLVNKDLLRNVEELNIPVMVI